MPGEPVNCDIFVGPGSFENRLPVPGTVKTGSGPVQLRTSSHTGFTGTSA
jgi:hypothetical protein